ncbi:MAG: hypothetical protein KDC54_14545 [Lewinella sp.]|nr:hypothetical protein [Lewinella sp.]
MEQRDLLKDQIEQMGKVLRKILAGFLGLKSEGRTSEGIEVTNQRLQNELDLDIEKMATRTPEELRADVVKRQLTAGHLEDISAYLVELGMEVLKADQEKAKVWFGKAIELLDISDEITQTMSFDRFSRRNAIKDLLQPDH